MGIIKFICNLFHWPSHHYVDECLICHEAAADRVTTTWGEIAKKGKGDFTICADCHGPEGEGGGNAPSIIGPNLRSFGTAWRLFNFISAQMPEDGPGSLSIGSYQRILAFMLTQSGFVQPEAIFDENDLVNVILE